MLALLAGGAGAALASHNNKKKKDKERKQQQQQQQRQQQQPSFQYQGQPQYQSQGYDAYPLSNNIGSAPFVGIPPTGLQGQGVYQPSQRSGPVYSPTAPSSGPQRQYGPQSSVTHYQSAPGPYSNGNDSQAGLYPQGSYFSPPNYQQGVNTKNQAGNFQQSGNYVHPAAYQQVSDYQQNTVAPQDLQRSSSRASISSTSSRTPSNRSSSQPASRQ